MMKTASRLSSVILALSVMALAAGAVENMSFTPHEEEVARYTCFDRQVLALVKGETREPLHRLWGYDEEGYQIIVKGISASVPEDKADPVLASLRKKLQPLGYLAFVIEINEGMKTASIGIIKGTDQYEILKIMHTNGEEYDITHEDVMERLKEWEKSSPFDIIGAENNWVELEFKTLPKDVRLFAAEVYDFCPDPVDQEAGSIEELAKEIKKTKRLMLWWD